MQQLAGEQQRLQGVRATWHVGDIAWGLGQHEGREHEWTIRLWEDGERVVAWSWLKGDRGLLEHDVHPEHRDLLDEILDEPAARSACAFEDDEESRAVLARHGFVEPGGPLHRNVASYVLVWPDDENGVALFEPVGTHAEFRRRGLGAAVCTYALRRLYDEGLRVAIVACVDEPACSLYESVGFRRHGTVTTYTRS